jgi:hypothetical protein
MRGPSFRVRTLMSAVVVVALLVWGSMMGSRSFDFQGRARMYAEQGRGWREIAARKRWDSAFASECADYFEGLTRKYRRATWSPWLRVEPDPWAPGAEAHYREELEKAHQNAPTKKEK